MNQPVDLTNLRDMTDGDMAVEKDLFNEFMVSSEACIAALKIASSESGADIWHSTTHALKGSALNLGAASLGNLCKHAQEHATAPAPVKRAILAEILEEYARVKAYLHQVH